MTFSDQTIHSHIHSLSFWVKFWKPFRKYKNIANTTETSKQLNSSLCPLGKLFFETYRFICNECTITKVWSQRTDCVEESILITSEFLWCSCWQLGMSYQKFQVWSIPSFMVDRNELEWDVNTEMQCQKYSEFLGDKKWARMGASWQRYYVRSILSFVMTMRELEWRRHKCHK